MPIAGLAATVLALSWLAAAWARSERRCRFGPLGWTGVALFLACGSLLVAPRPKPAFLVPLAWSGYVMAVDAAVFALRGRSLMRSRPEAFLWLAILSVFLWLPFEWYNLRLAGWYRSGLPHGLSRYGLLGWNFACVWPALLETAELAAALLAPARSVAAPRPLPVPRWWPLVTVLGAACLCLPLAVPRLGAGEHLLALASCGFLLLLDPLNWSAGRPSLWRDWCSRSRVRWAALAVAGTLCGLLADFLNYWSEVKRHSIVSLGAGLGVFEIPFWTYLLFPLFGLQAFAMYQSAASALGPPFAPTHRGAGDETDPAMMG